MASAMQINHPAKRTHAAKATVAKTRAKADNMRWSTSCSCTCTRSCSHGFSVNDVECIRTEKRAHDIRPSDTRIATATASYKPKTMQAVLRDTPGDFSSGSYCRRVPYNIRQGNTRGLLRFALSQRHRCASVTAPGIT